MNTGVVMQTVHKIGLNTFGKLTVFVERLKLYFSSPSTRLGLMVGLIMYVAYAIAGHDYTNVGLMVLSGIIALLLPSYSRFTNKVEEYAALKTACVSIARCARFLPQLLFNLIIFKLFIVAQVVTDAASVSNGRWIDLALLTTVVSQGLQYIAIQFANREHGDKNTNVMLALAVNIVVTAFAACGVGFAKQVLMVLGGGAVIVIFLMGFLSDLRSKIYPECGVGVFFGTFNPMHKTHLKMIRDIISERNLAKVLIHPTVIPKLHRDALKKGEIEVVKRTSGMRVYSKTNKADVNVNYFPTGNMFYEYETRDFLLKRAIEEVGLAGKVEVLSYADIYAEKGFYGVMKKIKQKYKGVPIHGIHGSDLGGMWVRNIYDECGWVYPYAVRRTDNVSATSIRAGAEGMATRVVEFCLKKLKQGSCIFKLNNREVKIDRGVIKYGRL
jgi:nicotinic acid mononucleotide adenylyltransferase